MGTMATRRPSSQVMRQFIPLDKSVDKATAVAGERLTYTMVFSNTGTESAGLPEYGVPVVLQESIPAGTSYITGTAATGNSYSFTPAQPSSFPLTVAVVGQLPNPTRPALSLISNGGWT